MSTDGCFFCRIAAGEQESDCVIYQDDLVVVFPGLYQRPQNQAHIEVVTRAHVPTLYELDDESAARAATVSRQVALALKAEYGAEGVTIHQHNEAAGGQHLDHYHMHVVPRYADDQYWASVGIREHEFLTVPRALLAEQAKRLRAHFS
ncbi:HIT family protein [Kitasatospora purpeofusca]|uniref:HIT family protein n=1 Tax=Kitasatospora purpeofusca TaxID=67352 RepID=UPI00380EFB21